MNTAPELPANEQDTLTSCSVIKTGRPECLAYFNPARYQISLVTNAHAEKIDLGYSGSRLLERLLQVPGEVMAREDLMAFAWSDRVVGQGSLNQQIYTLRQILGDEKTRTIIQTLPRRGYMFNPQFIQNPVSQTPNSPADQGAVQTPPPAPPAAPITWRPATRCSLIALPVGLALVLSALLAYAYQTRAGSATHTSELVIGQTHIVFIAQREQALPKLIEQTRPLAGRLARLSEAPSELILSRTQDYYDIYCHAPGGTVRSLTFHRSQLDALADDQLRRCLP